MQINLIFTWKVLHLASVWQWEFKKLGNGPLKKGPVQASLGSPMQYLPCYNFFVTIAINLIF